MQIINFEFKAKVNDLEKYEQSLCTLNPIFKGTDYQKDTYFNATFGRLKLREGNIEHALIQYDRPNTADAKVAQILLYQHQPNDTLKQILTQQLGIKVIVEKIRKIYFIDNVKFHFDIVSNLGTFIEVEAIDHENKRSIHELKHKCDHYLQFFELNKDDLIDVSYSDMIFNQTK